MITYGKKFIQLDTYKFKTDMVNIEGITLLIQYEKGTETNLTFTFYSMYDDDMIEYKFTETDGTGAISPVSRTLSTSGNYSYVIPFYPPTRYLIVEVGFTGSFSGNLNIDYLLNRWKY